jgi:hypothetical protein
VSRFGGVSKDKPAKFSPLGSKFMASFGNHAALPIPLGAA